MPDATIIGAGPAGCVAAIVLARRGWDVTLIEQHRFPRDKVCGECLSSLGVETLDRLNLLVSLRRYHPAILSRACLVARDGTEARVDLPRPMWGLSRLSMDDELLEQANLAGVNVVQPARCEKLESRPLRLHVRDLISNRVDPIEPSIVLVADGKAALGLAQPRPTRDLGVKAHFKNVNDDGETISLFTVAGHYVGLAPIENGLWNAAMSVPAVRVKSCGGDLDALWNCLLQENPGLSRRMGSAMRTTDWLASPLPRFGVIRNWPDRVIPLGNAAAALEPIGGEGMGLAMRSAELTAEMLASGAEISKLQKDFRRLWTLRRISCRAAALAMSSQRASKTIVSLVNGNQWLARTSLHLLGKHVPTATVPR